MTEGIGNSKVGKFVKNYSEAVKDTPKRIKEDLEQMRESAFNFEPAKQGIEAAKKTYEETGSLFKAAESYIDVAVPGNIKSNIDNHKATQNLVKDLIGVRAFDVAMQKTIIEE